MLSGFTVQMRYMMCLLASHRNLIRITIELGVPRRVIVVSPSRISVTEKDRRIAFKNLEMLNDYLAAEL